MKTRVRTGLLLKHFDIKKPQIVFHEHNEEKAGRRIVGLCKKVSPLVAVSDAGTPGWPTPAIRSCGRPSN